MGGNDLEEWKDIKGFEGLYQVSNFGKVRSCGRIVEFNGKKQKPYTRFHPGKICSLIDHGNGYLYITLGNKEKRVNKYVHRLVAEAFIPNPKNKPEVNHIDYNKSNNNVSNLEWVTKQENVNHSKHHMKKIRSFKPNPRTGEHHIGMHCGYYRVVLKTYGVEKLFKNLEDAIAFRNKVLYENGYTNF